MRPLLYGAVFFSLLSLFNVSNAQLKVALVDTGFCPDKALVKSKLHKIKNSIDMTSSNNFDCGKIGSLEMLSSGRFHGQKVLNEFLNYLPKKTVITITPIVVYDRTGSQTPVAWKKAITFIEKEKFDLVLTASGLIDGGQLVTELPSVWFVPSGRMERMIDAKTVLFPQNLAPKPNLFVIGDFYNQGHQIIYDQSLKYQDQIDYYFPSASRQKDFSGTSRAVAEAAARAIERCFINNGIIAAHSLRLCLLKKEKILKDPILKLEFKTF